MDRARFKPAYQFALGTALVYLLLEVAGRAVGFGGLIPDVRRSQETLAARSEKLGPFDLERRLRATTSFTTASDLHCVPSPIHWDYVCNYMPTPTYSETRLQFGINVTANGWTESSVRVPMGTQVPPPHGK